METSVNTSVSPSLAMWSTNVTLPYLKPEREPGNRWGASVIDSMPPATTVVYSPARIN